MKAVVARKRIQIQGVVQGVGFRPFVYRIAQRFDIRGHILNSSEGVVIEAEAEEAALQQFVAALATELPSLAKIDARGSLHYRAARRGSLHYSPERLRLPDVSRWCRRMWPLARTACGISRLPATGDTAIPSQTAPTAARGTRSSAIFLTIAPTPRWTSFPCALPAWPSTMIRRIGDFTRSRTRVRIADPVWR